MSDAPLRGPDADEALLAELFDSLLEAALDGRSPDPRTLLPDRPDLKQRALETLELALSVAGRREPARPILGGYEILRELGRGGMGTVYLARHEALSREVAIKVLPQSLALSPRSKRRFLDEARTLARLRHEHIVHIHRIVDAGEMLAFEMEHIDGGSLQSLLASLRMQTKRPQIGDLRVALGPQAQGLTARSPVEYFVRVGIAIARALAEVHGKGIVHRDVKPSNILLRPDGTPVLADFGLAREGDIAITQQGDFAGTPTYAAPERLRDGDLALDGRADVYSLGATLYEAISMAPPYQGRSTQEILRRIESGAVLPLRKRAPFVSRDLQTVIHTAMETDPARRYATATEFADDLERLLALQPIHARPRGLARKAAMYVRRHRKSLVAAFAGALFVVAGLWPVFDAVQASAAARDEGHRMLIAARQRMLEPDCIDFSAGLRRGSASGPDVATQAEALASVRADYDRALSLLEADPLATVERAAIETAWYLRTAEVSRREHAEAALKDPRYTTATRDLPAAAKELAAALLAGRADAQRVSETQKSATPLERFATGLLAALCGEPALCDAAWRGLDQDGFEHPLLDAGLGLLAAADGDQQRAYPRLFHAMRTFASSRSLQFELADAALANGDALPAQRWLQQHSANDEASRSARELRLRGDLSLAGGNRKEAEDAFRQLVTRWPADRDGRHRLALLAIERGDLQRARAHLELLLQIHPHHAAARLDLARIAIREDDRARYLEQAHKAYAQPDTEHESRGSRRDRAETLRIGGFVALANEVDGEAASVDLRRATPPASLFSTAAEVRRAEALLRIAAAYERGRRAAQLRDIRTLEQRTDGALAAATQYPGLVLALPNAAKATLSLIALAMRHPDLQTIGADALLPFQQSLGDPLHTFQLKLVVPIVPADPRIMAPSAMTTLGPADGSEELLIAVTPNSDAGDAGRITAHAVGDGRLLCAIEAPRPELIFGYSLCDLGDIDRDGVHDFAVGAPLRRRGGATSGSVFVYSGKDKSLIFELTGDGIGFGVALANLGDVDQDGVPDLAVGTSPEITNSAAQGAVTIHSGASGAVLLQIRGDRAGVWFGAAIAPADDIDGDGCQDVLIGGNLGGAPGLVRVHSSRTGLPCVVLEDDSDSLDFGRSVAQWFDIDGDGVRELAVAAPGLSRGRGADRGRVFVHNGRTGARIAALQGDQPGDLFGFSIAPLPNYTRRGARTFAISAIRQGLSGSGYVRTFDAQALTPIQTWFLPSGWGPVGLRLAEVSGSSRERAPAVAAAAMRPEGFSVVELRHDPQSPR